MSQEPSGQRPDSTQPDHFEALRGLLLAEKSLRRATAGGARRGASPRWRRVGLRVVDLAAGRRLQVEAFDERASFTSNHSFDDSGPSGAAAVVDDLLSQGFGHWHVESVDEVVALRFTAKDRPLLTRSRPAASRAAGASGAASSEAGTTTEHDRRKQRLLPEAEPVLQAVGIADSHGRIKPSRRAKYVQVEQFLRLLVGSLDAAAMLPAPVPDEGAAAAPTLRIVDLGCGNAYLTLAAAAYLGSRGVRAEVVGVDVKAQSLAHNTDVAAALGWTDRVRFVQAAIDETPLDVAGGAPDVVVALHACDTATDDALAFAVRSGARVVLAAPCCHHDLQRRLTAAKVRPEPLLSRHGILSERTADVLTDALRAHVLRLLGFRVDVVEFVGGEHTPRNVMIRAVRASAPVPEGQWREYDDVLTRWDVTPALAERLADELGRARRA